MAKISRTLGNDKIDYNAIVTVTDAVIAAAADTDTAKFGATTTDTVTATANITITVLLIPALILLI